MSEATGLINVFAGQNAPCLVEKLCMPCQVCSRLPTTRRMQLKFHQACTLLNVEAVPPSPGSIQRILLGCWYMTPSAELSCQPVQHVLLVQTSNYTRPLLLSSQMFPQYQDPNFSSNKCACIREHHMLCMVGARGSIEPEAEAMMCRMFTRLARPIRHHS